MRNLPKITILLSLLFGAFAVSGQAPTVRLKMEMEDRIIEHVYGLAKYSVYFESDYDSTTVQLYRNMIKIEARFNGEDWVDLNASYVDVDDGRNIRTWHRNQKKTDYIDLYYYYFRNPDLLKDFMRQGGGVDLRYSALTWDNALKGPNWITSAPVHIKLPPASEDEMKAFEYATQKERMLATIFEADELRSHRYHAVLEGLIDSFPTTYIGMMAGCIVSNWSCGVFPNKTNPLAGFLLEKGILGMRIELKP